MKRALVIVLALVTCLGAAATADVPRLLSYQGVLIDEKGAVPDGTYALTFRLWPTESDVNPPPLWVEALDVSVSKGIFSVLLGQNPSNPLPVSFDAPYWLGISVGTDAELTPRAQLAANPYALSVPDFSITQAKIAPGVALPISGSAGGDLTGTYPNPGIANDKITTLKILDQAVTEAKIAHSAVTVTKIASGSVTSTKIAVSAVGTDQIADGAVTAVKLGSGISLPPSGTAGGDLTGSYPNPIIGNGKVTQAKLAAGVTAVPSGAAGGGLMGSYPNPNIASGAVGPDAIATGAVTQPKLAAGVTAVPSGAATGGLTGSYPNPSIATGAVGTSQIADNSVQAADVAHDFFQAWGRPLAFGTVWGPGNNPSGSGNFQVVFSRDGLEAQHQGHYHIIINGEPSSYDWGQYSVIVTMVDMWGLGRIPAVTVYESMLTVYLYDMSGVAREDAFSFVVYKNKTP